MKEAYTIIDITQPVTKMSACFPGDTPFDYSLQASYADNKCYNLTSFSMSPHIGTHVDAPAHTLSSMSSDHLVGNLPIASFIGPCFVIDLCSCSHEIRLIDIEAKIPKNLPPRILFRTRVQTYFDKFEAGASLSVEVIEFLHLHKVRLVGIDTPSVDDVNSTDLRAHHALISCGMVWIENLDLTQVKESEYFLSAPPIKLMELEAAPLRAVLIRFEPNPKGELPC
ncbi:MAG: cyclase family protein [Parachlamydiaceae bacterium]|nr:cyclase family protein [Parachlamydiaceae bacterium]